MNIDETLIEEYFSKLGFSGEITALYIALHREGPQTISELSRSSKIERTRIYRLLDELQATNLIESELRYKRTILRAAPPANLDLLLSKREQATRELQDDLEHLHGALAQTSLTSPTTRVQSYQGPDGIKQMFWNQTRVNGEALSILYENMQSRTNLTFFERWARLCNERKMTSRSLVGDRFIATQNDWYSRHSNDRLKRWSARYISSDVLPIAYSTVIYGDVTCYFSWKDDEIFGLEIYNQQIADTQRRLFEILWDQASPLETDLKNN